MEDYRVNLDIYNGPMDLLLYLIRREEVDIHDIPIAHITQQYCKYVELIEELNPNLAGDFLVMASTLLEIKSRTLLPRPETDDPEADEEDIDPRRELVRQLLQYKAFKDAAGQLESAGDDASQRYPRKPVLPKFQQPELDMENIHIWDLLEAFNRIMVSVGATKAFHSVVYDDTPISLHAEDILDRLHEKGNMTFKAVFDGKSSRGEITGLFLAMLELIRQKKIKIQQESNFGEIYLFLNKNADKELHAEDIAAMDSSYETAKNEDDSKKAATESDTEPAAASESDENAGPDYLAEPQ